MLLVPPRLVLCGDSNGNDQLNTHQNQHLAFGVMKASYRVSKTTKPKHSWVQCVCSPYSYTDHTAEDGNCEQGLGEAPLHPRSLTSPVRWACGLGSGEPPPAHGALLVDDKTPLDFSFSTFHVGISPSVQVSGKQVMQVQWDTDQSFPKWKLMLKC